MKVVYVLLLVLSVSWVTANTITYQRIVNEMTINNHCSGDCEDVGTRYQHNKTGCLRLAHCKRSTHGWIDKRGYHCSNCECECQIDTGDFVDTKKVNTRKTLTEMQLYGTGRRYCWKTGLVKSNAFGCDEIRDCTFGSKGTLGRKLREYIYHNDYCNCMCVVVTRALKYDLNSVVYNMNNSTLTKSTSSVGGVTSGYIRNFDRNTHRTKQALEFEVQTEKSIETEETLETGIEIAVAVGMEYGSDAMAWKASINVETTSSINKAFTTKAGEVYTERIMYNMEADANIPPQSKMKVEIMMRSLTITIPFTADRVTSYENGDKERSKFKGILKEEAKTFTTVYGRSEPLDGNDWILNPNAPTPTDSANGYGGEHEEEVEEELAIGIDPSLLGKPKKRPGRG